jgi:hypothetical protein
VPHRRGIAVCGTLLAEAWLMVNRPSVRLLSEFALARQAAR